MLRGSLNTTVFKAVHTTSLSKIEREVDTGEPGTTHETFQQEEDFAQLLCDAIERYRSVLEELAEF